VGEACEHFSEIYRTARGVFVSYPDRAHLDQMIQNVTKKNVKVIVVTDGERILGLGDLGIGGMGIPIGKLSLYTACGGISPAYTLPMMIDVGTNNEKLLKDPFYLGWRHPRITGKDYDNFIEEFIQAVKRRWPNVLLQFEDFSKQNASPLLERYRTVVLVGAGSAGCGIADHIAAEMMAEGLAEAQARARIFVLGSRGLLTDQTKGLLDFQLRHIHKGPQLSLLETVRHAKPTVLIGVSGQPGLFTEELVRLMHKTCARPIVMPLSNPTSQAEATPEDVIAWTEGQALVATGSPFMPVVFGGKRIPIAQCNNAYIFPGMGLGVVASQARRVTDGMMIASSRALAECSPYVHGQVESALLPDLARIQEVSRAIAFAVAKAAQKDGVADRMSDDELKAAIQKNFWAPEYRSYVRA
jgi:malate dehydrogenase (oxaloacetate-decarboxylating)